jgi:hypothetical protein
MNPGMGAPSHYRSGYSWLCSDHQLRAFTTVSRYQCSIPSLPFEISRGVLFRYRIAVVDSATDTSSSRNGSVKTGGYHQGGNAPFSFELGSAPAARKRFNSGLIVARHSLKHKSSIRLRRRINPWMHALVLGAPFDPFRLRTR